MNKFFRNFIVSFLFITSIILITLIFSINIFTISNWVESIFIRRYYNFPLIVYVLLISLAASLIVYIVNQASESIKNRKVSKALKALVEGNYRSKHLQKVVNVDEKIQVTKGIDRLIDQLYQKNIRMALTTVNTQEKDLEQNVETKEEILAEERHRIARELHDSVSQHLFASSMMLSAVNTQKEQIPDKLSEQLSTIENIINESQSEMRALLLHLRPVALNDKTLKEGIEQLLTELSSKIKIDLNYQLDEVHLKASVEDQLFRIVQELLSNVLRHAKANELNVYMKRDEENIRLRVVDDGVGFNVDEMRTGSYGLPNTKERIASIGGNVKIISFKDQGTSVDIGIPIDLEEETND